MMIFAALVSLAFGFVFAFGASYELAESIMLTRSRTGATRFWRGWMVTILIGIGSLATIVTALSALIRSIA